MKILIICIALYLSIAQAFLVDATTWIQRAPGQPPITPAIESQQRGKSEEYAQTVGQITYVKDKKRAFGSATLIAPDIILTAAHCLVGINAVDNKSYFTITIGETSYKIAIKKFELTSNYILSTLFNNNFADISDIGLARLESPIQLNSYPSLEFSDMNSEFKKNISGGKIPKCIGISAGLMTKNGDPSSYLECRHIGIFPMQHSPFRGELVTQHWIPLNYKPSVVSQPIHDVTVPAFNYNYQSDNIFLHASIRTGDSGSPLFAKLGGEYRIIGVACYQNLNGCFDEKTQMFIPGKSYYDCWTSIHAHQSWIRDTLKRLRG